MKNILLVVLIALFLISCENVFDHMGDGGLSGRYYREDTRENYIDFRNRNFNIRVNGESGSGTYSAKGKTLELEFAFLFWYLPSITWTIVNSRTLEDHNGDLWKK